MVARLDIVRADERDVARILNVEAMPMIAYVGFEDGQPVGIGGLCWREGLCWLFLDGVDMTRTHPMTVVRWAKRMLLKAHALGNEAVYAARDIHPHSAKLLRMLGFVPIGTIPDVNEDRELWQHWPQSPQSPQQQRQLSERAQASIRGI